MFTSAEKEFIFLVFWVLQGAADISYQRRGSSYNPDEYDRRISLVAEQAQVCTVTS